MNPVLISLLVMVFNSIAFSVGSLLLKSSKPVISPLRLSTAIGLLRNKRFMIGNVLVILSFLFLMIAYRFSEMGIVLPMGSMAHIFSLYLGRVYFNEPITWNKIVGICCIFFGILFVTLG